jgi:hypothetical protein
MSLEIESDQGLSDEPGSLMDHVLVGLISAQRVLLFLFVYLFLIQLCR